MYADTELMFPYFQNFAQEVQQFDEFYCSHKSNASLGIANSLIQTSTISDYNLGGEGDLFKAPEPVIEEPILEIDPMTAAISMISCGENITSLQPLTASDIETSIKSGQLLSDVFYECKKDLLAKEGNETPLSDVLIIEIPAVKTDGISIVEGSFQKSVSFDCLISMEYVPEASFRPNFLDLPVMDFGAVYGMRRAYSEGDIKTLRNGNINLVQSPLGMPTIMSSYTSEERKEKLSRYRSKKSKRNFGRKIKASSKQPAYHQNWASKIYTPTKLIVCLVSVCLQEGVGRQPAKNSWKICEDRRNRTLQETVTTSKNKHKGVEDL